MSKRSAMANPSPPKAQPIAATPAATAKAPPVAGTAVQAVLGSHPKPPHPLGVLFSSQDGQTTSNAFHRALTEVTGARAATTKFVRERLVEHHVSPEALKRTQDHHDAMKRLGFAAPQARLRRFPTNSTTQKGNLAEIVLAEYVAASCALKIPVYRLRHNTNVDQSMKGDDVLAFDLDSTPPRIVVGEAKFRTTSTAAVVREIVEALEASQKGGIPASLQFVADRLFEEGKIDLGTKVMNCAQAFALAQLNMDYVGMLVSDAKSSQRVDSSTSSSLRRLAMLSLGLPDPDVLVSQCYVGLD